MSAYEARIVYSLINLNGSLYSVHTLKLMVARLFDVNSFTWEESHEIQKWLDEYATGGAMPSQLYFRCPHGHHVKFLDLLLCVWNTFISLEDPIHVIDDDEAHDLAAAEWVSHHLANESVGEWEAEPETISSEDLDYLARDDLSEYSDITYESDDESDDEPQAAAE